MRTSFHTGQQRPRGHCFQAALAAVVLIMGAGSPTPTSAKPERIVSINLCTDQLVMLLADRDRIASLSFLAADPRASAVASEVSGLIANHGLVEEILPMNPDLVLAGTYTTQPSVFLLRNLGYPVVELPLAANLDDIRSNIRIVAGAIGEAARGEAMIAAFDSKLPPQRAAQARPRPLAVLYWANGYTSGKGTLANAAVEAAGFRTLGRELGLTGTSQLPLETLLATEPDVLVVGQERDGPALANEIFRHPALKRAFATRPKVSVPDHLWVCGTPYVADAIAQLSTAREDAQHDAYDRIDKP